MKDSYNEFKRGVLLLTGIDLNSYRESQMKRRIDSFAQRKGYDTYSEFLTGMRQSRALLHSFVSYLTINVSEFCRNPEQWRLFETKIIPLMKANLKGKLQFCSAACSTGEEPYTLAMYLTRHFLSGQYHILATDLDSGAIEVAKKGVYPESSVSNVGAEFRERYLKLLENRQYGVKRSILSQVEFKKHDLLRNPYPENMDFICCRNVTIYFTPEAKRSVYRHFSQTLKPGGFLFIGSSEQIPHPEEYGFEVFDTFFYRKTLI